MTFVLGLALGVALGAEAVSALDQLRTDLAVIVDLAVKDEGGVRVVTNERLVTIDEVNDLQPNGAKSRLTPFKDTELVRTPMIKSLGNPPSYTSVCAFSQARKPGNSTHFDPIPASAAPREAC